MKTYDFECKKKGTVHLRGKITKARGDEEINESGGADASAYGEAINITKLNLSREKKKRAENEAEENRAREIGVVKNMLI